MKLKEPVYRLHFGQGAYKKLYSQIYKKYRQGGLVDYDNFIVNTMGGTVAGMYRTVSYKDLFGEVYQSLLSPKFKIRESNEESGKIFAEQRIGLSWGNTSVNFYQHNGGLLTEVISNMTFSLGMLDTYLGTVESIFDKIGDIYPQEQVVREEQSSLTSLDDKISDVLGEEYNMKSSAYNVNKDTYINKQENNASREEDSSVYSDKILNKFIADELVEKYTKFFTKKGLRRKVIDKEFSIQARDRDVKDGCYINLSFIVTGIIAGAAVGLFIKYNCPELYNYPYRITPVKTAFYGLLASQFAGACYFTKVLASSYLKKIRARKTNRNKY